MELEYIGEVLPDGHLSVDPFVAGKIKKGQKLKITIEISAEEYKSEGGLSEEAREFLDFLKRSAHRGGYRQKEITREFIHEDAI